MNINSPSETTVALLPINFIDDAENHNKNEKNTKPFPLNVSHDSSNNHNSLLETPKSVKTSSLTTASSQDFNIENNNMAKTTTPPNTNGFNSMNDTTSDKKIIRSILPRNGSNQQENKNTRRLLGFDLNDSDQQHKFKRAKIDINSEDQNQNSYIHNNNYSSPICSKQNSNHSGIKGILSEINMAERTIRQTPTALGFANEEVQNVKPTISSLTNIDGHKQFPIKYTFG